MSKPRWRALTWLAAAGCGQVLIVGDEAQDFASALPARGAGAAGRVAQSRLASTTAGGSGPLRVLFLDGTGRYVDRVVVPCGQLCAPITAEVSGDTGSYTIEWEDGSTSAMHNVCLGANAAVRVTDTGARREIMPSVVFPIMVENACVTAAMAVTASVSQTMMQPRVCVAPPEPRCDLGGGVVLPEELTVDVSGGTIKYYAQGATLPAGRYRVTYIDGCATFGGRPSDGLGVGWSVNGQNTMPGLWGCYLVDNTGKAFAVPPGTIGSFVGGSAANGGGAYMTYAECVAANCDQPPFDFDYSGGKLGVARDGGGVGSVDDLGGEVEGGRSPTFRLTRLDPCL